MKKSIPLFVLALALLAGCGPKSTYTPAPGAQGVDQAYGFKVGQVEDRSGLQFSPQAKGAFNLQGAMIVALREALARQGLAEANGRYSINVDILAYDPGNAAARMIPGAGATYLSVKAAIMDNGVQAAIITAERKITGGWGFKAFPGATAGAYRYVFDEVAQEIAAVIKKSTKAKR